MDYSRVWIIVMATAFVFLCWSVYWNLPYVRRERRLRNLFYGLSQHCGPALSYFRMQRGHGEKDLARMLGKIAPHLYIDEVTIIVIERGDLIPDFQVARAIVDVLGFSINDFIRQMARLNNRRIIEEERWRNEREPVNG